MRILSLNAWGGRLHDRLIHYLAEADPDVLCLQEVIHTPTARSPWLTYRDDGMELPQRARLFEEVAGALPGHRATFCPAARGDLFDGDEPFPSEWGLATYVRASLAVIGQVQDFVHGEFSPDGYGPHPRSRNAHAVRLHDYGTGLAVTVAHMHGLRDPGGKADSPAREAQAERLAGLIRRLWRKGERLVVCGDFNVLPGSATFAVLGRLGLVDLVTARGHVDTRTSHYGKSPRFADYMLVNAEAEVRRFEVVAAPEVSDHRALSLDLA